MAKIEMAYERDTADFASLIAPYIEAMNAASEAYFSEPRDDEAAAQRARARHAALAEPAEAKFAPYKARYEAANRKRQAAERQLRDTFSKKVHRIGAPVAATQAAKAR